MERENLIGQELDVEKELRKLAEMHLKRRVEEEKLRAGIEKLKPVKILDQMSSFLSS